MENREKIERPLMSEEELQAQLDARREQLLKDAQNGILPLRYFNAVSKHKSVGRAFRRGHSSFIGEIYPKSPFNNRANTSTRKGRHSRVMNELKKNIYEQYKSRKAA